MKKAYRDHRPKKVYLPLDGILEFSSALLQFCQDNNIPPSDLLVNLDGADSPNALSFDFRILDEEKYSVTDFSAFGGQPVCRFPVAPWSGTAPGRSHH